MRKRKEIRAWNRAVAILDRSEIAIRTIIEDSLADVAGVSGLRYGEAMRAANATMERVAAVRTEAFRQAFRVIQARGGV